MYFDDHPPPHFHARYGGDEAVFVIATGELLAGSLPPRALRLVREWLRQHRDELAANFECGSALKALKPVAPPAMNDLIKIIDVQPLDGYWLRIRFSDGAVKDIDLGELLARGGVFAAVHADRSVFEQVRVNPDTQTIEWPGEVDLDPEVLYGRFQPSSGVKIRRRTVREPATA